MSNNYSRATSLSGIDLTGRSSNDLRSLVRAILDEKIHGISFSPYLEGQGPGTELEETQIRARLGLIQPHVQWIRSFSCTDGLEQVPRIATESGLKTLVGVWLGSDTDKNELEIENAIEAARAGHVNMLGVGNEVLLRGDLSEDELIRCINKVKDAVPDIDVGYVDAYFQFVDHPRVAAASDVILANCYPFWEGCPADHALLYMKEMYRRALQVADGKKVIISETGWPNIGSAVKGAIPSFENAIRYFVNTYQWAQEDDVEIFWFSSFDEAWKVDVEGDVGAYWGLWDTAGRPKYF